MKAVTNLKNLECKEGKNKIVRNLSRILDIRIIDIDVENKILVFAYANPPALQKVKQELFRIGYPMQSSNYPRAISSKIYGGRTSGIAAL